MPRRRNPECLRCAAQSVEVAQAKPCWKGQPCHAKRSYYAKHAENKARKRSRQRADRIEALDIPLYGHAMPPEVLMAFYRDRADGPIHALAFTVIENGKAISHVKPIHLKGVPQAKLRSHIKNVLGILNAQFNQELAVSQSRQPVAMCPLCQHREADADG